MHKRSKPDRQWPIALAVVSLLIISAIGVAISTAGDIELGPVADVEGLTDEESAYYEYVAPRLDRLVTEVDGVVEMVEAKSRDIIALTVAGARIEELTSEITEYGQAHGVPDRFAGVHALILDATETATYTFDQARAALRSFDFSGMTALVTEFQTAAETLREAQAELRTHSGGTGDALGNA